MRTVSTYRVVPIFGSISLVHTMDLEHAFGQVNSNRLDIHGIPLVKVNNEPSTWWPYLTPVKGMGPFHY